MRKKNKIPLKIKQTHFLAHSPNLTFKTDHFSENSFPVSLIMSLFPRSPCHASLLNDEILYTCEAPPQLGGGGRAIIPHPAPTSELIIARHLPQEESRRHRNFFLIWLARLTRGRMQGLRPYCNTKSPIAKSRDEMHRWR